MIFDPTPCKLGEGPLWHPERRSLFWFDITQQKLYERAPADDAATVWEFDEMVSAAGWVDRDTLLVASETALSRFDLITGESRFVVGLESENPNTRSNDGRADPQGGFWIGTMGKNTEVGVGAIYRYYQGALRRLFPNITIPNAICFTPDGRTAYFTDTPSQIIKRVALNNDGWPAAKPEPHIDLRGTPYKPDGAVVDADGYLWNAQWGSHRVARYDPSGQFVEALSFDAAQISCPAFGGADLRALYATSARIDLDVVAPFDGATFVSKTDGRGQREHQVRLE